MTETKITDENRVRRVQFEQGTVFPDPHALPSPTRKHVPRMSLKQKQEYQLNNYYPPTTSTDRCHYLSSLLLAAAGPSLVISTSQNNEEFRDYSTTTTKSRNNMSHQDSACRHQKRLARR